MANRRVRIYIQDASAANISNRKKREPVTTIFTSEDVMTDAELEDLLSAVEARTKVKAFKGRLAARSE